MKKFTPINILILVLALIQHVNIVNQIFNRTLIMATGTSLEYFGTWYCLPVKLVFEFDLCYNCVGSLGIAIFRILYIKHDHWVKETIGENTLLRIILFGGVMLTSLCMFAVHVNDYEQLFNEKCMLVHNRQVLDMLDDYEQSRGNTSIYPPWLYPRQIVTVFMLLTTIAEITIYVIFFHHMYKHDNSKSLRDLMDPAVTKARNRTNAISFFGQFCSFALEFVFGILVIIATSIGTRENGIWIVVMTLKTSGFMFMSIVEVVTSRSLRPRIFKW